MRRRAFLIGSASAAAAVTSQPALSQSPPVPGQALAAGELAAAAARLRAQFLKDFEPAYVENVIIPHFLVSVYEGERPLLPLIDVTLTKENALPNDLWGLLSKNWKPSPEKGVTVFLQGLEKRGPENRQADLMCGGDAGSVPSASTARRGAFFDKLLSSENAGKPLMRPYLDAYWDLYWDLHLGVKPGAIPLPVRQIGESFNTVLAYRDPTQRIVYENYMTVRSHLDLLKSWIDQKLADIASGKTPNPDQTFAWYWMKNGAESECFDHKDVVF